MPTTVSGDLSSWIFQLHGVKTNDARHKLEGASSGVPSVSSLTKWMAKIAGPESDPRKTRAVIAKLQDIKDSRTSQELTSLYRENRAAFDSEFKRQALKVKDVANIPDGLPALSGFASSEESLKMLRANRALAMCLSLHEAHPLSLMARAAKGDRQAALDLIKVDKLFLHDRCTENLIKKAELQNDRAFMKQLARAQIFVPKLSTREIQRLYFYQLFLMEQAGVQLPTQHELWRILDPRGRQYRSLSAFERDFQRRRKAFERMLDEVSAETKGCGTVEAK